MKSAKKKIKDTPEKQHARFVEAAEKAGADEAPDALNKSFRKLNIKSVGATKKTLSRD